MTIIKSGILIITILIIRNLAWKHISRRVQYSLWIFAALYMLFGSFAGVHSNYSMENILTRNNTDFPDCLYSNIQKTSTLDNEQITKNITSFLQKSEVPEDQLFSDITDGYNYNKIHHNKTETLQSNGSRRISGYLLMILACLTNYRHQIKWGISGIILCIFIISNTLFIRKCLRNRVLLERNPEIGLNIFILDNIDSPFLLGKNIYIDSSVSIELPSYRHIIIHEYCHFKNMDYIWVFVRSLLLIVNWYNPFMWIAYEFIKRDCELACDEAALEYLGNDEGKEYCYTLLSIAQNQCPKVSRMNISTSMSSDARKLKERIERITDHGSNRKALAAIVIVCMLLLTGYMFLNRTDEDEAVTAINPINNTEKIIRSNENNPKDVNANEIFDPSSSNGSEMLTTSDDLTYNIYNSVKYYKGYFYYSDKDGLKRISDTLSEPQSLAEGGVRLGNADKDYIYYIRYPSKGITNAGILRLNTNSLAEERLIPWDYETSLRSDNWLCRNVYVDDSIMYLEYNDRCEAYEVRTDRSLYLLTSEENKICSLMDACSLPRDSVNEMIPGYLNVCFRYGKLVKYLPVDDMFNVEVYDIATSRLSYSIENCETSVLATDRGIVYTNADNDIYLRNWDNESYLLYNAGKNSGIKITYGTYDQDFLYGFYEDNGSITLAMISWDGTISYGFTIDGNMKDVVSLGYSVNNLVQSYWQNDRLIFEPIYVY